MGFRRICLVHYHEIGLKGHNRSIFENRLLYNIEAHLAEQPIQDIKRISGRILILIEENISWDTACRIEEALPKIPGVARVSCGYICERNLDTMGQAAICALGDVGDFTTFKVTARRNHTDFPIDSMTLNRKIGAVLCEAFPDKIVKMKNPDVTVHVEVIQGNSYIYARSQPGIGGLPVGSSGRVVSLLSSGIDSPVATWRMARRGAVVIGVHFSGRPQTSSASEYLVDDIAHHLERTGCIARVYMVPFGDYQRKIAVSCPPDLRIILYRRLMFRVAERIAQLEGAKALVTGESLGQVASQTIENILVTNEVVHLPVFRPLIGSDKQEIIAEAEKLGTFEFSSQDAPDCCTLFMPRTPETHAKPERVQAAEKDFPIETWLSEIMTKVEVHDYICPAYRKRKQTHAE